MLSYCNCGFSSSIFGALTSSWYR